MWSVHIIGDLIYLVQRNIHSGFWVVKRHTGWTKVQNSMTEACHGKGFTDFPGSNRPNRSCLWTNLIFIFICNSKTEKKFSFSENLTFTARSQLRTLCICETIIYFAPSYFPIWSFSTTGTTCMYGRTPDEMTGSVYLLHSITSYLSEICKQLAGAELKPGARFYNQ